MSSEHSFSDSDTETDPDEGPGMVSNSVNKPEAGLILSGPGGRPITDDVPETPSSEPRRLEDAAAHDQTGQSEKP